MNRLLRTILAGVAIAALSAATAAAEGPKVVASFSIIGDMASRVGGDRIELVTLVGPDGDAHVYEPRPADAAAMAAADLVLVNGLNFEGFLQRLVAASGTGATVVELSRGAELVGPGDDHGEDGHDDHADGDDAHDDDDSHDHAHGEDGHDEDDDGHHHHGPHDPHAWQSVHNALVYVRNIADALCAADAPGCDVYRANAEAYSAELEALDAEIRAAVAGIAEDRRVVITSHDAFGYFEHEYGLAFLAPRGISTEADVSAADVARLIRQIRDEKAAAIFVENITNPRLVEQIASETGLSPGGSLYSDALSGPDGPASTYVDMMRHNIRTIASAIAGS